MKDSAKEWERLLYSIGNALFRKFSDMKYEKGSLYYGNWEIKVYICNDSYFQVEVSRIDEKYADCYLMLRYDNNLTFIKNTIIEFLKSKKKTNATGKRESL